MISTETTSSEPDDTETRYDLAGNPLPPLAKAAVPPAGIHYAPAPSAGPVAFVPPPGSLSSYGPSAGQSPAYAAASKTPKGPLLYFGLTAGLLLLVGLIFGVGALKPKLVAAPTSYKTYTAIDNSFSCDQPGGWTLHETGATSGMLATATFEDGHARVRIISDATGSLIADTMSSGNANLPPAQQVPAVEKLHALDEKQFADGMADYKEGDAQKFQSGAGDARVSEWTAEGSLHGYRVTMLGNEREFTVICFCPSRNWAALMPAFQRIISSLKPGTGS
ncbi:MAG: hypothetical protein ACRYFS_24240 [Janthinobacterium lividum]